MHDFCEIKGKYINYHTNHEQVPKEVMKYSEN